MTALDREHFVELAAAAPADADGRHPYDVVLLEGDVHHGLALTPGNGVHVGLAVRPRRPGEAQSAEGRVEVRSGEKE